MKRLLIFLPVLLVMLYGCGGVKVGREKIKEETSSYTIDVSVPVLSGLSDEQLEASLNEGFKNDADKLIEAFKTRVSDKDSVKDELVSETIVYTGVSTVSIINSIYEYNGGNHGTSSRPCVTVDVKNNKVLEIGDLFTDDKWREMLNRRLSEEVMSESEKYSDLWEKPVVMDGQCFYIDGKNLVIYYPPYELSYYARGFVDFTIPLDSMPGYVKKEYLE